MRDSPDPTLIEAMEMLAVKVREASHSGNVIRFGEVWSGTEDEFLRLTQTPTATGFEDIRLIRDSGHTYLYSDQHMTHSYAETAARACCGDIQHVIAETVRQDSHTYPRPTPVAVFTESPFLLSRQALTAAVEKISRDAKYADIRLLRASDGSLFLFSSAHLDPAHAESLAEWIAVGHLENP